MCYATNIFTRDRSYFFFLKKYWRYSFPHFGNEGNLTSNHYWEFHEIFTRNPVGKREKRNPHLEVFFDNISMVVTAMGVDELYEESSWHAKVQTVELRLIFLIVLFFFYLAPNVGWINPTCFFDKGIHQASRLDHFLSSLPWTPVNRKWGHIR